MIWGVLLVSSQDELAFMRVSGHWIHCQADIRDYMEYNCMGGVLTDSHATGPLVE